MHGRLIFMSALIPMLLASVAPQLVGQQTATPGSPPDSVAARRLTGLVDAINSGSGMQSRAYFQTAFAPEQLQGGAIDRMVAFYGAVYDRSRGLQIHELQLVGPTEAAALLRSELTGTWEAIAVRIEPTAPHRIVDVGAPSREMPVPTASVNASTDAERVQALERFMEPVAASDVFSGVILLAKGDSVLFLKAYGEADKDRRVANQTNTRFGFASITKMFTAVAIAQLVEQGKLSFDDPISQYLPGFRNREAVEKVRIKHLLSHTSGIPDYLRICERVQTCPADPLTLDDFVARVNLAQPDTLRFEPGNRWAYSNAGYVLLGKIIEIVSGEDYTTYVRERVLRPAGMSDTDFFVRGVAPPRFGLGYEKEFTDSGVRFRRGGAAVALTELAPSDGGAYGTAEDLLLFARALLGGRLVGLQTLHLLLSPKPELGSPSFGYGFALDAEEGSAGHGGIGAGASNSLDTFPQADYIAIVLSNYSYARTLPRDYIWALIPNP